MNMEKMVMLLILRMRKLKRIYISFNIMKNLSYFIPKLFRSELDITFDIIETSMVQSTWYMHTYMWMPSTLTNRK